MTRPNRDLDQAGHTLQNVIAYNLSAALEHLAREITVVDGFPERGDSVQVSASAELTSVERAADTRYMLRIAVEDLRDAKNCVLIAIRQLNDLCNEAQKMRVPRKVTKPEEIQGLCCNGAKGKDGVMEWGSALNDADTPVELCMMPAVRRELCQKHYQRYWRWMEAKGIDMVTRDDLDRQAMLAANQDSRW